MTTPLKHLMDEHNLKVANVAVYLDVSPYTVYAWLSGKRNMPDNLLELLQFKLNAADTGDK